jgi:multiple sugar transport system substrate-binding protein
LTKRHSTYLCGVIGLLLMIGLLTAGAAASTTISVLARPFANVGFNELIAEFEKQHPDIKVEMTYATTVNDLFAKLSVAMAAGAPPDAVGIELGASSMATLNAGFRDLDPYLFKQPTDYTFFPAILQALKSFDGRQVLVPFSISLPMVLANTDMFDQAGVVPNVTTWNDLLDTSRKLMKSDGGTVSVWGISGLWNDFTWLPAYWSYGGELMSNDGSQLTLRSGDAAALKALNVWYDLHVAYKVVGGSFQRGTSALYMSGLSTVNTYQTWNVSWGLQAYIIPRAEDGQHAPFIGGDGWAIPTDAKNPDAAWVLIDWMNKPSTQRAYMDTHNGIWFLGASGVREVYGSDFLRMFPVYQAAGLSLELGRRPHVVFLDAGLTSDLQAMLSQVTKGTNPVAALENFTNTAEAKLVEYRQKQ